MSKTSYPFVSIVVCTFNRSNRLNPCLKSLREQTYPLDRYEIIVVDDGSTDSTLQTIEKEGVNLIHHEKNKGIPAARNSGIAAAKGEIVAFIDDDAVADPHWLEHLMLPFEDPTVGASGGKTLAIKTDRLTERYLLADEYGNPASVTFGESKNSLWRFFMYLKTMFAPVSFTTKPTEVQAVFGLNCAYRTVLLRTLGGFDETLLGDEDSELSVRFRVHGARIIFIPTAIIHHHHRESLIKLIRQTYYRAESTFHAYRKEKKSLPIFPLPVLYIIISICLLIAWPMIGFLFIILGPLLLYSWWLIRGMREHTLEYVVYPYIQLSLELTLILGLARGGFRSIMNLQ